MEKSVQELKQETVNAAHLIFDAFCNNNVDSRTGITAFFYAIVLACKVEPELIGQVRSHIQTSLKTLDIFEQQNLGKKNEQVQRAVL